MYRCRGGLGGWVGFLLYLDGCLGKEAATSKAVELVVPDLHVLRQHALWVGR